MREQAAHPSPTRMAPLTSTPDTGSTVLLMGLGVASLGFLRRKIVV